MFPQGLNLDVKSFFHSTTNLETGFPEPDDSANFTKQMQKQNNCLKHQRTMASAGTCPANAI